MKPTNSNTDSKKHLLTCSQCKHENKYNDTQSKILKCENCNAINSIKGKDIRNHNRIKSDRKSSSPWSFLALGQKITYNEITYKIIGRIDVKVKYTDFSDYKQLVKRGSYQEWFCKSEKGDEMSVTEDMYGYYLSWPSKIISNTKRRKNKIEWGDAKVIFFEGESSLNSLPGTKFQYEIYQGSGGNKFGFEWTEKNKKDTHYYYVQKEIARDKLYEIIEEDNDLNWYKNKLSSYNFLKFLIIIACLVFLLLIVVSLNNKRELIYSEKVLLKDIPPFGKLLENSLIYIEELNKIYEIEIKAEMHNNNSDIYSSVELLDNKLNAINLFIDDFYYYYGYESGGYGWEEKVNKSVRYHRFEKKGNYQIRVYKETGKKTKISSKDFISIEIKKGLLLSRYFIIAFIISILILFLLFSDKTKWKTRMYFFKILH